MFLILNIAKETCLIPSCLTAANGDNVAFSLSCFCLDKRLVVMLERFVSSWSRFGEEKKSENTL